jgi:pimeloyl-ACP methyl ester carboxylesterase
MKHRKSITHFEKIQVNDSYQWVLVRGKNTDTPLLIHVQAGPGLPMISEADKMEKLLHLEEHFLVAYWDQRGCGLSYNKDIPPESINLAQMADDIIACTKLLLKKYNKSKAVIAGYSIGATVTLMAAAKDSSLFSVLFVAGTDVDIPFANQYMLDFALDKAVARKNKKWIKKINELKSRPIVESIRFQERAGIIGNLGGIQTGTTYSRLDLGAVNNMLFSKYYGVGGLIKTMAGITFCQNSLLPEMNHLNLFQTVSKIHVPVHFIQGKLDAVAPAEKGKQFYEHLQAPDKSFSLFENSAHVPQYEESEKFSNIILSYFNQSKSNPNE